MTDRIFECITIELGSQLPRAGWFLHRKSTGVITMLIHVMYPENKFDYVKDFMLDKLIGSGKVAGFQRAGGWVSIGVDPVRAGKQPFFFSGVEKRARPE
jgi:hypothetical protein